MAQKRMINKIVSDEDRFMDMHAESQALYFHMNLKADDEGFVAGPYRLLRMLNIGRERLDELADSEFIFLFGSGIALIRHWHIHNNLRRDRVRETIYQDEKALVCMDDCRIYCMADRCPTDVRQMSAQEREDKNSIDKNSIDKQSRAGDASCGESLSDIKLEDILKSAGDTFPYKLTAKAFADYIKLMDIECIAYAIEEATLSGKRSLGYVRAVLNRLLREGVTTKVQLNTQIKNRHGPPLNNHNKGVEGCLRTDTELDDILERMEKL
jgi:DnaD/phage-associated family protein